MKQRKLYLSSTSRVVSALIWLGVMYLTLPRLFRFTFNESFWISLVLAAIIFAYDSVLFGVLQEHRRQSREYKFALSGRLALSVIFALIAAFGITVNIFLTQINRYLPGKRANYIQKFKTGIGESETILLVFVLLILLFFLLDSVGRFVARLQVQEKAIEAQEAVIEAQESQLLRSYQQQLNMISSIQHELGNKLPIARGLLYDLRNAFEQLEKTVPGFTLQQPLRPRLSGEPAANIDSYATLLTRLDDTLFYAVSIVDNIKGIIKSDPASYQAEQLSLGNWLHLELPKHTLGHEEILVRVTGDNPQMQFDPRQLSILLNNLVKNAIRHAFEGYNGVKELLCEVTTGENQVDLKLLNTGHPLPNGFTMENFLEPGKALGRNGNSGLGGYLVGMIAANHNAEIIVKPADRLPFTTQVLLSFTI